MVVVGGLLFLGKVGVFGEKEEMEGVELIEGVMNGVVMKVEGVWLFMLCVRVCV